MSANEAAETYPGTEPLCDWCHGRRIERMKGTEEQLTVLIDTTLDTKAFEATARLAEQRQRLRERLQRVQQDHQEQKKHWEQYLDEGRYCSHCDDYFQPHLTRWQPNAIKAMPGELPELEARLGKLKKGELYCLDPCPECEVEPGELHLDGCPFEECPLCKDRFDVCMEYGCNGTAEHPEPFLPDHPVWKQRIPYWGMRLAEGEQ